MTTYGFHASHEQLPPSELLRQVQAAQQAGFSRAMCSDHFAPFGPEQGESGFAWSWLGAALASTDLPFGVVNAPGQRYHPAIIAQAAATLAEMFPDRFWMAVGSGELVNEHITGERWPAKDERNARLLESVQIMRALFAGETVSHRGLVTVDRARLWTLPASPPAIFGAAVTPETARWVGSWADGLITVNRPVEQLRPVIEAYREGGGAGKPVKLQVHLCWDRDEEKALRIAHEQWRTGILGSDVAWDLAMPAEFARATAYVRPDDMREHVLISNDPARHTHWLNEYADLGFDEIYLHHVGLDQRDFLETFATHVLPDLT
ncbi:TIGR03885 family FMN-dependent LLM class oxidoreductase [Micromonospora sp. NBC_01796]|uniref:TIGR03885 family FMN-dependent LLM class oxidoreductase n=1 Tax=Micromonospora sp. NBC_01796 TaxID=2975987 RepID=UPI002DD84D55|nr:TIGR03885 family FMN-dependent LLM class oxidoreductase [Micromonospora sp. NBC_01796]WSA83211.1 TIGR03885 family FMN-dependent LLM class oxidoreductase [Micromonospora sp. NBC_01796]